MTLVERLRTSFGEEPFKAALLVKLETDEGIVGWGECSAEINPGYSAETVGTAQHILREFLIPAMLGKRFSSATEVPAAEVRAAEVRGPVPVRAGAPGSPEALVVNCCAAARDLRTDRVIANPAATSAAAMAAGNTDTPSAPVIRLSSRLLPRSFFEPMDPA